MRCTSPRTVGFLSDGVTLCWSPKKYSKEYAPFQIPCGKCISCRLESARQTAVRCVHEASMYENNCFITLTYSDENLKSDRLVYADFQLFVKKLRFKLFQELLESCFPKFSQVEQRELWKAMDKPLRKELYEKIRIGVFVTGEYGDIRKRPHWHAIIFNWKPHDLDHKYNNYRGDKVYNSASLDQIWGHGITEIGSVTFESAGYVARYATKKLQHGRDGTHDFTPISRRSCKSAIGKRWIEKYYLDVFKNGFLVLDNGIKCGIPRYYEKWYKQKHPESWSHYVTHIKTKVVDEAVLKEERLSLDDKKANAKRIGLRGLQITRNKVRETIMKRNLALLSKGLKL